MKSILLFLSLLVLSDAHAKVRKPASKELSKYLSCSAQINDLKMPIIAPETDVLWAAKRSIGLYGDYVAAEVKAFESDVAKNVILLNLRTIENGEETSFSQGDIALDGNLDMTTKVKAGKVSLSCTSRK